MGNGLDWAHVPLPTVAGLLTKASGSPITEAMIQADIKAGSPVNPDGTVNLIRYCAWLAQLELQRGR
jgi:hypothetical protein